MIGVITAATQSGCVLGYDLGDKKNKDQRIKILDFEGVWIDMRDVERLNKNWTDATSKKEFKKLSRAVADDLSKQFDGQAEINENVKKTTGHIALSFSPLDREKLTHALKLKIAKEYMERMGITNTQWVLTEHYDTNAPHLHIAYNRVRFDSSSIDRSFERIRNVEISRELSEKYGLTPAGKAERKRSSLSPKRQKFAQMREDALKALECSLNLSEFQAALAAKGISLQIKRHGNGEVYGLGYSDGTLETKGSKLDRAKLSYSKVIENLQRNQEAEKKERNRRSIEEYISQHGQVMVDLINHTFGNFDSDYHLVPGILIDNGDGSFKWILHEDGYTSDNKEIFHQHEPAPQPYGESYVNFSFNDRGELLAVIEADKTNYYSKGVSGRYNLTTGTGEISERRYMGAKKEHKAKKKTEQVIPTSTSKKKGFKR